MGRDGIFTNFVCEYLDKVCIYIMQQQTHHMY